jgi:RimJ/RimL family protein N-acetyltransferase
LDGIVPASAPAPAGRFPEVVPLLVDPAAGVLLRPHGDRDVPAIVEQCRDPESIRWITVPTPPSGYDEADARSFLSSVADGWQGGGRYGWAIELLAVDGGTPLPFAGSIDLRPEPGGVAEVGFGLHPAARGRRAMTAALRLVRDHGFDTLGLRVLRWRAAVGNWASRRTAAAAGFRFDGTVRSLLVHRDELLDGWVATLTAADPRTDLRWRWPPVLTGPRVRLRPFAESDLGRVVEACSETATQHWLLSLPSPYTSASARSYLEEVRQQAAHRSGWTWCVTDAADRCLGAVSLEGFGGYARRLEIGYWAHPDARGRGLVAEAVRVVTALVADDDLADSVIIRCAAGNVASRRVATAAGYRQNGVQPASEPLRDETVDDLITYTRSFGPRPAAAPAGSASRRPSSDVDGRPPGP